jgi:serine/threonine protein kinase
MENIKTCDEQQVINKYTKTLIERSERWSVDIWALGIMLIEIISGFPIWLPMKC